MQLIDYIDYWEMYKKVKKNQLTEFPTAQSYIEELKGLGEPYDYVEEMYNFLLTEHKNDFEMLNSDNYADYNLLDTLKNNKLLIELSEGGNDANESGDNYWGYGFQFTVDLEYDLFVGYSFENYS